MLWKMSVILMFFFLPFSVKAQQAAKNTAQLRQDLRKKKAGKKTYSDDESSLARIVKPVTDKISFTYKLIWEKSDEILKLSNSDSKDKARGYIDSLNKIADQLNSQLITSEFNFIRNNPSSYFSLDRLSMIFTRSAELPLYVDTIKSLFNHFDKSIQNSAVGRKFQLMMVNQRNSEVGSVAPGFIAKDINGLPISLTSYRNNDYVLLDFWASWCVPCREDMPFLKKLYKKYHTKGLEIIAISKDDDASQWGKAVAKDTLQIWRNILAHGNNKKIGNSITDNYFIYGIPVKILINKDGVIIGRWSGGGDEKDVADLKNLLSKVLEN